jgi:hypothetical protein
VRCARCAARGWAGATLLADCFPPLDSPGRPSTAPRCGLGAPGGVPNPLHFGHQGVRAARLSPDTQFQC